MLKNRAQVVIDTLAGTDQPGTFDIAGLSKDLNLALEFGPRANGGQLPLSESAGMTLQARARRGLGALRWREPRPVSCWGKHCLDMLVRSSDAGNAGRGTGRRRRGDRLPRRRLFGIGGGAISVPVFFEIFGILGYPTEIAMPLAVGTSLAVIIPTSIISALAHYKRGTVDLDLLRIWAAPVILGVLAGSVIARYAAPQVFQAVFIGVGAINAAKLLSGGKGWRIRDGLPSKAVLRVYGAGIGLVSRADGHRRRRGLQPGHDAARRPDPSRGLDRRGHGRHDRHTRHHRLHGGGLRPSGPSARRDRLRVARHLRPNHSDVAADHAFRRGAGACPVQAYAGDGVRPVPGTGLRPLRLGHGVLGRFHQDTLPDASGSAMVRQRRVRSARSRVSVRLSLLDLRDAEEEPRARRRDGIEVGKAFDAPATAAELISQMDRELAAESSSPVSSGSVSTPLPLTLRSFSSSCAASMWKPGGNGCASPLSLPEWWDRRQACASRNSSRRSTLGQRTVLRFPRLDVVGRQRSIRVVRRARRDVDHRDRHDRDR